MSVVDPLKLVIDNYPEDKTDILEVEYHPDHPEYGSLHVRPRIVRWRHPRRKKGARHNSLGFRGRQC